MYAMTFFLSFVGLSTLVHLVVIGWKKTRGAYDKARETYFLKK